MIQLIKSLFSKNSKPSDKKKETELDEIDDTTFIVNQKVDRLEEMLRENDFGIDK